MDVKSIAISESITTELYNLSFEKKQCEVIQTGGCTSEGREQDQEINYDSSQKYEPAGSAYDATQQYVDVYNQMQSYKQVDSDYNQIQGYEHVCIDSDASESSGSCTSSADGHKHTNTDVNESIQNASGMVRSKQLNRQNLTLMPTERQPVVTATRKLAIIVSKSKRLLYVVLMTKFKIMNRLLVPMARSRAISADTWCI